MSDETISEGLISRAQLYDSNHLTAANVSNAVDNNEDYKNKNKQLSFESNNSIYSKRSNGEEKSTFSSITSTLGNLLIGRRPSQQPVIARIPDTVDNPKERFASNIAISPDGQYVATFNCKKLEFKIFKCDTRHYLVRNNEVITNKKFVNIPNLNHDSHRDSKSYEINQSVFKEYLQVVNLKKKLSNLSTETTNQQDKSDHRTFPTWSIAISNLMEHNGELVMFITISAIVESDMIKREHGVPLPESKSLSNSMDFSAVEYENKTGTDNIRINIPTVVENVQDSADETITKGKTAVFRITFNKSNPNLIQQPCTLSEYTEENIAGIVLFVQSDQTNHHFQDDCIENEGDQYTDILMKTSCLIINAEGIFKIPYSHRSNDILFNYIGYQTTEKFSFPKRFDKELQTWYKSKNCMERLLSCIYNHYFLIEQYKDGVQTCELINLMAMEQEQIFSRYEDSGSHNLKNLNITSVYAISNNRQLLAFSKGLNSVNINYIENGLEVGVKKFGTDSKITFIEFIDDDERILLVIEEEIYEEVSKGEGETKKGKKHSKGKEKHEKNSDEEIPSLDKDQKNEIKSKKPTEKITKVTKIIIWDLFSSAEDAIRIGSCNDLFPARKDFYSHLAKVPGQLLRMNNDGTVYSILHHEDFLNHITGVEKDLTQSFGCTLFKSREVTWNQAEKMPMQYSKQEKHSKLHQIFRRQIPVKSYHKPIIENTEPWVDSDNYYRRSIYLDDQETLQLIIGHSTVQIWRKTSKMDKKDKKVKSASTLRSETILEYIWTNGISLEYDCDESALRIQELWIGDCAFSLTLIWNVGKELEMRHIRWPYPDGQVSAVRHACEALEHLHIRKGKLIDIKKQYQYEELVEGTNRIIWRFIKKRPEVWRLMDIRFNVMANLIRGGACYLIKFILFGDDNDLIIKDKKQLKQIEADKKKNKLFNKKLTLHIPRTKKWMNDVPILKKRSKEYHLGLFQILEVLIYPLICLLNVLTFGFYIPKDEPIVKKEKQVEIPSTDLECAIEYCKGKERKDAIMVGYLLEYYSENAIYHFGWMITISKALPLLYRNNLDYYVKAVLYKECFADMELGTEFDTSEIIPEERRPRRNSAQDFVAFKPVTKLISDKNNKPALQKLWEFVTVKIPRYYAGFVDNFDVDQEPPPIALRVVPLPNFTVDNIPKPVVSYNWKSNLLRLLKILIIPRGYIIGRDDKRLLICFAIISAAYMSNSDITGGLQILLILVMACFYYLAYYLIAVEVLQLLHHGWRDYLSIINMFDIFAVICPAIVMSIFVASSFELSDSFGNVETSTGVVVGISFTMLLIWCEMILYLRLLSEMAMYIYYIIIIFKTVWPYYLFMIICFVGFAHAHFLLLQNPNLNHLAPDIDGYTLINATTNETLGVNVVSDFDPSSTNDNPYTNMLTSIQAAYFWVNGEWSQRGIWDFWAVDFLAVIASLVMVTVLQNMLIAFMGGVYEEAAKKGRDALLRYRADLISDYEALEDIRFWPTEPDPTFIFYVGHSKSFDEWSEGRKDFRGCIYKRYENKASYKKYDFKEDIYDEASLMKYEPDKVTQQDTKIKNTPSTSSQVDELYKEFQQSINTVNERLDLMDKKIDTKMAELEKNIQNFIKELLENR
ncbi:2898_t:CDS:10 [Funneliformis caledonium]|uniref:2898_t:CDS:1 n=1 Tax=Funneliformis caledonium TaxID=1117310 RepID=A0A9N9G9G2_9GLOM|nr:2898_t:CDS:10 [Funneliformis caledonium]